MLSVICVYRSGGDYTEGYVLALAEGIRAHLEMPHKIVCLTDRPKGLARLYVDEVIPMENNWPGWWSKLELFRLPGPLLYFDLDTCIVGDITPWAEQVLKPDCPQIMLRGFYRNDTCSGIMGWHNLLEWVYPEFLKLLRSKTAFQAQSDAIRLVTPQAKYRGDQEYLSEQFKRRKPRIIYAQDVAPGICSYKVDVAATGKAPQNTAVICFHGRPRPHEVGGVA